jgi:hypothetical protein
MYLHCIGFVLHFLLMMMMMVENLEHLQRTAARLITSNRANDAPVHFA